MIKRICILLLLAIAGTSQAAEVRGVNVPESVQVGAATLVLNGAGLRTRLMFKVYVGALYLPEKKGDAPAILGLKGSKRVALHMLRDLSAEQLSHALDEGLAANLTAAEQEKFHAEFDALHATMNAVGNAKEKSVITIDYLAESGATRVAIDGAAKGTPIPGEDFYRALLKIWLGDKPVDADLKAGLLGKG
jgi:hypothetical protein